MLDDAITGIIYATANASGATVTGLPAGVSGTWAANTYTVSGTPSTTGTFNYTVTTTNSNGCSNAAITGTITVNLSYIPVSGCSPAAFSLGTIAFANADTYTRNGIILSAPVTPSGCQKGDFGGSANCRNANTGYDAILYTWCMVAQYAAKLCPSPWRVPSAEDYLTYMHGAPAGAATTTAIKQGQDGWLPWGEAFSTGTSAGVGKTTSAYCLPTASYPTYNALWVSKAKTDLGAGNGAEGRTLRCVQDAP
jgi:hypothetical protein